MYAWQTLTGIGFMFHSAPQAFFLNQVGGILSIIVLCVAFASLLKTRDSSEKGSNLLNLPLLGATMLYSMPMVIFQQAKDMKLDTGLFFVSVIGIYALTHILLDHKKHDSNEESVNQLTKPSPLTGWFRKHADLLSILFVGVVIGLAFAIKFTSLMLIIGVLGLICFAYLGLGGFF